MTWIDQKGLKKEEREEKGARCKWPPSPASQQQWTYWTMRDAPPGVVTSEMAVSRRGRSVPVKEVRALDYTVAHVTHTSHI
jgi:hypothetical protein